MRGMISALVLMGLATGFAAGDPPPSGLRPGEEVSAWEPIHVAGPHAGTKTCPVCTYLEAPVLLAFARDARAAADLAPSLEQIAVRHARGKLKVMLVVLDGTDDQLRRLAADCPLRQLMLCRPDPARRASQLKAYKIDSSAANTIMLYQDYVVRATWTNLPASNLSALTTATDAYFPTR